MRIAALVPLHIRRAKGDLHLRPGVPVELPDEEAKKLLHKVPGKVRVVPDMATVIELAITPDCVPLRPVYWQRPTGEICGPANPEFFATDEQGAFWLVFHHGGQTVWACAEALRSRQQFEQQRPLREVEPIRADKSPGRT